MCKIWAASPLLLLLFTAAAGFRIPCHPDTVFKNRDLNTICKRNRSCSTCLYKSKKKHAVAVEEEIPSRNQSVSSKSSSEYKMQSSSSSRRIKEDARLSASLSGDKHEKSKQNLSSSSKMTSSATKTSPKKKKIQQSVKSIDKRQKRPSENSEIDSSSLFDPSKAFNIVLTHCTADFDTLASAVGLAKLWSTPHAPVEKSKGSGSTTDFDNHTTMPTYVVLPRGAHPSVHRFLALHEHLFPIRSLKSFTEKSQKKNLPIHLNRIGLVDAQRKDRIGPAHVLLPHAKHVTIVDHHVDSESDIIDMLDDWEIDTYYNFEYWFTTSCLR